MTAPQRRRRPAALPDPPPPAPYGVGFDWKDHRVSYRGPAGRCQHCGRPALMENDFGEPEHKICAEGAAVRDRGEDAVRAELVLHYTKHKHTAKDGVR